MSQIRQTAMPVRSLWWFVLLLAMLFAVTVAAAQDRKSGALLDPGQVVVTGFAGTMLADSQKDASDATKIDQTFLDPDGAVVRIVDVGGVAKGKGSESAEPAEAFALTARDIGQVFGITIDDARNPATDQPAPNIYLGASSAYGLHIVVPDRDGDGWPERVETGDPEADWMEGLFGASLGGGPGTVWKIDGVTGEVSVFADIATETEPNSGAGLGNLSFDAVYRQIFVSDLETGLIHRLDLEGKAIDSYDHGAAGRAAEGLPPVEDDPEDRADPKSVSYKSSDPTTWGYAQPPRRVWGVKVHDNRLYYSVAEGPEIWSVGLDQNGAPADPRREITLPLDAEPYEVADISFTATGWMILAQRPPVTGGYDYVTTVASGPARVLRYRAADETEAAAGARWVEIPEEYAVGLKDEYRNTAGGVALGYGYKDGGGLDYERCEATLWTTGEGLLQEATRAIKVEKVPGFATSSVDGLQGTDIDVVRPDNVPPENARFVDYDGRFVDNGYRGYLGDVEIPYHCAGDPGPTWEPEYAAPYWQADYDTGEAAPELDLAITKRAVGTCRVGQICRFEIRVENRGDAVFYGPVVLSDTPSGGALSLVSSGPAPWACAQSGGYVNCHRPSIHLKPGRSLSLWVSFRLSSGWTSPKLENCAVVNWLATDDDRAVTRAVQMELARRGYYAGATDGIAGPATGAAIEAFQTDAGLEVTGSVGRGLVIALFGRGAWRAGDAEPGNDQGCAVHAVDGAVKPKKDYVVSPIGEGPYIPPVFYPKTRRCDPGYYWRGDACVRLCPVGTVREGNRCLYVEPEVIVCRGGRIPTPDGECVCPVGAREVFNGYRTRCETLPRIRCIGGRALGGQCFCPLGFERSRLGGLTYICEPRRDVVCIGGAERRGRCECPLNTYLVDLGEGRYRCVRRVAENPVCIDGVAEAGRCYCAGREDPIRLAPGVFRCDRKVGQAVCIDGVAKGDRCECYGRARPVRVSRNVYECRKPAGGGGSGITCLGGTVSKNRCVCRKGYAPDRISERVFRCDRTSTPVDVVCRNGTVTAGKCVCAKGDRLVRAGGAGYACVPTSPRPPVTSTIVCSGGRVANGRCICPKGDTVQPTGSNAYRCVSSGPVIPTRPVDIICRNGTVVGGKCVCAEGDKLVRSGETNFSCLPLSKPPVTSKIVCEGGRVANGRCVCPKGDVVQPAGSNAYRCVAATPTTPPVTSKIVCSGGRVTNGRCVCPKGDTVQATGANAYRCVSSGPVITTPPTDIVCRNGKVAGGKCVCGNGVKLTRISERVFACVKVAEPPKIAPVKPPVATPIKPTVKIVCVGGSLRGNRCVCKPGQQLQQAGPTAFRCVAPQGGTAKPPVTKGEVPTAKARLICAGGKVAGGRCVCAGNRQLTQIGATAFRCVAPAGKLPPKLAPKLPPAQKPVIVQ